MNEKPCGTYPVGILAPEKCLMDIFLFVLKDWHWAGRGGMVGPWPAAIQRAGELKCRYHDNTGFNENAASRGSSTSLEDVLMNSQNLWDQ